MLSTTTDLDMSEISFLRGQQSSESYSIATSVKSSRVSHATSPSIDSIMTINKIQSIDIGLKSIYTLIYNSSHLSFMNVLMDPLMLIYGSSPYSILRCNDAWFDMFPKYTIDNIFGFTLDMLISNNDTEITDISMRNISKLLQDISIKKTVCHCSIHMEVSIAIWNNVSIHAVPILHHQPNTTETKIMFIALYFNVLSRIIMPSSGCVSVDSNKSRQSFLGTNPFRTSSSAKSAIRSNSTHLDQRQSSINRLSSSSDIPNNL
jgi:hypothetical protein